MATIGLFENFKDANSAYIELIKRGINKDNISFLTKEDAYNKYISSKQKVEEGTITGVATGGLLGLLASIGAIVIPGFGPVVATGIFATTLTGAAAGAMIGVLVDLGIPEKQVQLYVNRINKGDYLLTVNANGRKKEVVEVFTDNNSLDIDE